MEEIKKELMENIMFSLGAMTAMYDIEENKQKSKTIERSIDALKLCMMLLKSKEESGINGEV